MTRSPSCTFVSALGVVVALAMMPATSDAQQALTDPLRGSAFGLYDTTEFRIINGDACDDCAGPKAARWYFRDDVIAVPKSGTANKDTSSKPPFLVWLSAPEMIEGAQLSDDGKHLQLSDKSIRNFAVIDKIASNRSYYNETSAAFFSDRMLRIRGTTQQRGTPQERFVARVIWPFDYRVDLTALPTEPLADNESISQLIEADNGGAQSQFSSRVLWSTPGASDVSPPGRTVLGLMLNGAQGDDDEAHGGHFAVVTGRFRSPFELPDWMVNNFYNLGTVSEKGIIAAMLPMDNYLMDLNSGQSYYRPSYLLFVVLRSPQAAVRIQEEIINAYDKFYRHHIEYDHARLNCAGISVDALRTIGWNIPALGPTSYTKATLGYFYSSATDLSYSSGRRTFNYLTEDQTRLYPRSAFEVTANDLLAILNGQRTQLSAYEKMLKDNAEAVVFVRIPQVPSSRAFGTYPIGSFDAYMARVPKERKDWKIVPVDSRAFPDELRDKPAQQPMVSDQTVGAAATFALVTVVVAPIAWWRGRKRRARVARS